MISGKTLLFSAIYTANRQQQDIQFILKTPMCVQMQLALQEQEKCYRLIQQEAQAIASSRGWEFAPLATKIIRVFGIRIQLQFIGDKSNAKAAAWVIQCSTKDLINISKRLNKQNCEDERALFLYQKLLDCTQSSIRRMQRFL